MGEWVSECADVSQSVTSLSLHSLTQSLATHSLTVAHSLTHSFTHSLSAPLRQTSTSMLFTVVLICGMWYLKYRVCECGDYGEWVNSTKEYGIEVYSVQSAVGDHSLTHSLTKSMSSE